jgi:hypothetical protein
MSEDEDLPPTLPLESSDEQDDEEKPSGQDNEEKEPEAKKAKVDSPKEEDGTSNRELAIRVLGLLGVRWEECERYSGRRMYGKVSDFAVILPDGPRTKVGSRLQKIGMAFDNMAFDWVYYFE